MTATKDEVVERLDFEFTPPCEAQGDSCGGNNPADYLAVSRLHPGCECFYICAECAARKIAQGHRKSWRCSRHNLGGLGVGLNLKWLDFVTLHPVKGQPHD